MARPRKRNKDTDDELVTTDTRGQQTSQVVQVGNYQSSDISGFNYVTTPFDNWDVDRARIRILPFDPNDRAILTGDVFAPGDPGTPQYAVRSFFDDMGERFINEAIANKIPTSEGSLDAGDERKYFSNVMFAMALSCNMDAYAAFDHDFTPPAMRLIGRSMRKRRWERNELRKRFSDFPRPAALDAIAQFWFSGHTVGMNRPVEINQLHWDSTTTDLSAALNFGDSGGPALADAMIARAHAYLDAAVGTDVTLVRFRRLLATLRGDAGWSRVLPETAPRVDKVASEIVRHSAFRRDDPTVSAMTQQYPNLDQDITDEMIPIPYDRNVGLTAFHTSLLRPAVAYANHNYGDSSGYYGMFSFQDREVDSDAERPSTILEVRDDYTASSGLAQMVLNHDIDATNVDEPWLEYPNAVRTFRDSGSVAELHPRGEGEMGVAYIPFRNFYINTRLELEAIYYG